MAVDLGFCFGCMSQLGEHSVCPKCGYDNSTPYDKNYLRPGCVVGSRYLVGRCVRKNGEGALYIAYDNNLKFRVWVREYFPYTLAGRDPFSGKVVPRESCGAQFKALLSDFVDVCNEVKRLCITEPVIPIENVFADNATVYAVYKDLGVISLESWLNKQGGKLPVKEARALLMPIFNALSNIHARSDIHRGISPFTIYIDRQRKLYLWDFCMSATRTGGSELEAELFNGYSAPEQYVSNGWQGTWTDVYAAAALFYRVVSGFVPPKSTMINDQRPLAPLSDLVMDIPTNISTAVADAMHPVAAKRTQEMGVFVAQIVNTTLSSTAVYDSVKVSELKKKRQLKQHKREESRTRGKYIILGMFFTVILLVAALWIVMTTFFPELVDKSSAASEKSSSQFQSISDSSASETELDTIVPDFTGKLAEEVQSDPAYKGIFAFKIQEGYSDKYQKGEIFRQSPDPGTEIDERNNTIILFVSQGKQSIVMPDLVGLKKDQALKKISDIADLVNADVPYTIYSRHIPDAEPGTVVSTVPPAGTEFDFRETGITIFYMPEEETASEAESSKSSKSSEKSSSSSKSSSSKSSSSKKESSRKTQEEFDKEWNKN